MDEPRHRSLGLTDDEYESIHTLLRREPNDTELAMFSIMWSEHASYKSSRALLGRLPSRGSRVIMGPGENAGVVALTDSVAVAIRMESHNHPSAIEPHQGAATGVGGILRDIFTVGARPIALLDSLWMGPQDDARSRWITDGVVGGISAYGNAVGVPTVGGELRVDACYGANPLVNVVAVGVAPTEALVRARAEGIGNYVVLLGAPTGRDGIGGVSVLASAGFDATAEQKRPSVQVGDPFEEKKLIEACLALMRAGLVTGVQDLGGAGLTCATSETAAAAGVGMDIFLDAVPRREPGMTPMEVLCSESQERMLAIVEPGLLDEVIATCRRFEVTASVIGVVRPPDAEGPYAGEGVLRAFESDGGPLAAVIPARLLAHDGPRYRRPMAPPADLTERRAQVVTLDAPGATLLAEVVNDPIDPAGVWRRYDHMLFRTSLVEPGADAALLRVRTPEVGDTGRAIAITVDGNNRWTRVDPRHGATWLVAEGVANLACVGATPLALVDCLNFGNPEHPTVMWQLAESIDGIAEAARALGVPVVGGNVSLYNEADGIDIDPTPIVSLLGERATPTAPVPAPERAHGSLVVLAPRGAEPQLAGSRAAAVAGVDGGTLAPLDWEAHRRLCDAVADLVVGDEVSAATNLSAGGLARSAARFALRSRQEARLETTDTLALVGEHPSRVLVATDDPERLVAWASAKDLDATVVGSLAPSGEPALVVGAHRIVLGRTQDVPALVPTDA
ncbi:phosphoribosylformylglycinamidine synthase II [Acidimicrobium ferrooxidans DSM 10331]|uniref:Phosphoribosylformylglycinamidine synthase subunit PurL n=1 Tax=Acidimicrobium ferrooxidans (strain DSM 10331 / JCM 15462 / NBRC 103882 / ICP) TaxID=525909 RepID=C7M1V9_ACIFD|nr:phosphoribosylformylglycinamidine synthase subunit PurL [Acidimicrobium ferrooxidans]ACU54856.1 phosphoribosylformylglycinamidine synthase II [Acidimicrobium ferrooxidans DSM 10331]